MSDQGITSDGVEAHASVDQDMEFEEDMHSLFGDAEEDTTTPELLKNDHLEKSQGSTDTQVPAPENADDDVTVHNTAQETDEDEKPAAQHTEISQDHAAREEQMVEPGDDMAPEPVQEEVTRAVEEELGLASGSLNDLQEEYEMEELEEELQTREADPMNHPGDDVILNDANAGRSRVGSSTVPDDNGQHGQAEPINDPMHGSETATSESLGDSQVEPDPRQQRVSYFQPARVEHEPLGKDSSSLFIPEQCSSSAPSAPVRRDRLINMPPPSRPSASTLKPAMSAYEKIKNMQKANEARKKTAQKQAATARQHAPGPTRENYLGSVTASITPSESSPRPAVDEAEMEDRKALAEYQRQVQHYNGLKRKNNGKLTFRQDVEWLRIKATETARERKRARDIAKANEDAEEEPPLFPEAYPTQNADDGDGEDASDDGMDLNTAAPTRKRSRRQMPHKALREQTMQEAELQSMKVALDARNDLPNKKRKTQPTEDSSHDSRASAKSKGSKAKAKAKAKATKTVSKSAARAPRKTAKSKREAEHALKQASSLLNANVFAQQAGADEPEPNTFKSRKKEDALKELIASVPLPDLKKARSEIASLHSATKDFDGHGAVKASAGNWLLKGMSTSLKGYQIMGSAFMRRRENAVDEPRGGLLADQMGLGKTLASILQMMLANIVNGLPRQGHYPRTTLLVASPSLLAQWSREITQHTASGLKVMRYGSGNRLDSTNAIDVLKGHDIVLTTYSEVMKSYPKNEPPDECQTPEQKEAWWKTVYETQRGLLHKMQFLRIVLDEAQAIKNHQGRTSIACRALMATHKWALSGTPILNSLTELYPYFKFLGVPHTGSFKIFRKNYCDTNNSENTERLLLRLAQFMLRRTHADKMFNAPILKLPLASQGTYYCDFNPIERCIYDIVEQRFIKRINMWQANNELDKSYGNAMVLLLRLRQLTAHVLMLQFVMKDLLEVEDIEAISHVVQDQPNDNASRNGRTIIAVRKQLEKHAIDVKQKAVAEDAAKTTKGAGKSTGKSAGEAYAVDEDVLEDDEASESDEISGEPSAQEGARLGGSGRNFGKTFDFKPYLSSLKAGESWEKAKKRATCSCCDETPEDPWIADCGHLICSPCNDMSSLHAAEEGNMRSPCQTCGKTPKTVQPCEMDELDSFPTMAGATRSKQKTAAKKRERQDREGISEDWLSMAGADVLPSAKTLAVKAQILNWKKEDPKVKIIIYTQFLAMVKILGRICQQEGWQAEQYTGTMGFGARDEAISTFADNDKCNILLASLRCGGLGLNLTMASRVIMVDPWWNEASEQQAFCRVFRIGQKEETFMSRLVVKDTVDSRLLEMQARKTKEIGEVMEGDKGRLKKLGDRDLMRLFGNLDEDAEGKPFIVVDEPNPRGGFRVDGDDEGYADDF